MRMKIIVFAACAVAGYLLARAPRSRAPLTRPDDETLAALLAGRIKGRRRDGLLAYLAADHSGDYDTFADTAAMLREAEEEDAQANAPAED